jgi:hypothetical protein
MEEKFHRENKTIETYRNSGRMGNFSTVEFLFHIFISMEKREFLLVYAFH